MLRRTFLKSTASTAAAFTTQNLFAKIAAADMAYQNYRKALQQLRRSLQGTLILPSDPDYLKYAISANARFNSVLPLAIALCKSPQDVSKCILWTQWVGVPLAPKAGGHNYEGASTTNGLLIVTRPMNQISIDRNARRLVVQAGALNGELLVAMQNETLMLPIGTCPQVGVCGLTLGGGIGENSRWAGMTSDRLRSTNLVLANGSIITADISSYRDLFWACRGAGGDAFGIHTELTFDLLPLVSPTVSGFYAVYQGASVATDVFLALDHLMQTAPNTLNGFVFLRTNPVIFTIPDALTPDVPVGQRLDPARFPIAELQLNYQGSLADLQSLIEPIINVADPAAMETVELPFWQAQSTWLAVADQPSHGFSSACRFADKALSPSSVKGLVSAVLDAPFAQRSKYASVELMCWAGGVVQNVAPNATAYVHRNSTTIPRVSTWWLASTPVPQQQQLQKWMLRPYGIIKADSQNESFQNFPSPLVTDWPTAYYGENLPALVQVKKKYDPQNVFRHAQGIPPGL